MHFLYPFVLLLWLVPLYYLYAHYTKAKGTALAVVKLANLASLHVHKRLPAMLLERLPIIRAVAMALMIAALARPQVLNSVENVQAEGIDIVLALDVSNSMFSPDLNPNRLEAAKMTALSFIRKRPNDQMGLVLFAGESFTLCPLTIDHSMLMEQLANVGLGKVMKDGTAIGMGLATAVNRLKESQATSKVVILLTDGVNNSGTIDPQTALELTLKQRIVVYTIGVGMHGNEFDEKLLKEIAEKTGGKYFHASSNRSLSEIYDRIDQMEKSKFEVENYVKATELYRPFLGLSVLLLVFAFLFRYRWSKSLS